MEKVAVVQLDTMSLRLLILEVEGIYYRPVEEVVENLKLGNDVTQNAFLNVANIAMALRILKMFRKLCDSNKVTRSYAIASPIFKLAKNEKSFFEEIYNNTGFNFQILTDEEEMRTIYSGVVNNIDCPKGVILHIDWDYSAVIFYNRRNIVKYFKIREGCLSLAEKFEKEKLDNTQKYQKMKNHFLSLLKKQSVEKCDEDVQVVCSGVSFLNIGKLARKATHYPLDLENNYFIDSSVFKNVCNFVQGLDLDKTMKLKGITTERADALSSGVAIAEAMYYYLGIKNMQISSYGMREGLVYNNVIPTILEKPLSEMMNYSLDNIRLFYDNKDISDNHLYALTVILFKQIKVLHKLPRVYIKSLKIAAALCESGKRINFEDSVKASFDVILHSPISGASHKEILIGAFASLCQEPDNLNLSDWIKYKDILDEDDLDAVRKIGMIIKLASILDRSKNKVVEDISCDVLGDSVILKTIVNQDASFEILLANKLAPQFKKIFKKNLQVI